MGDSGRYNVGRIRGKLQFTPENGRRLPTVYQLRCWRERVAAAAAR